MTTTPSTGSTGNPILDEMLPLLEEIRDAVKVPARPQPSRPRLRLVPGGQPSGKPGRKPKRPAPGGAG